MNRTSGNCRRFPLAMRLKIARAVFMGHSIQGAAYGRFFISQSARSAAGSIVRVDVDEGFAAVQLLEDRPELGVSEPHIPVAGRNTETIGLEDIPRIFDF